MDRDDAGEPASQARRLPRTGRRGGPYRLVATGVGLLAARLAHLASNAEPYLASPWLMLDLRDGGWHAVAGALAGATWLVWRGWKMPPCRQPFSAAALAGLLVWTAGSQLTGGRDSTTMPAMALATLESAHFGVLNAAALESRLRALRAPH